MNHCNDVRENLPGLLYGDLPEDRANVVRKHLGECPACRQAWTALQKVRQAMDAVPPATVNVDVSWIYRQASLRQERRLRRWRRLALAGLTATVVLLILVRHPLEVRLDGSQLVIRWGGSRESAPSNSSIPQIVHRDANPRATVNAMGSELEMLRKLIHALADNAESRDRDQQDRFQELQEQIRRLQTRLEPATEHVEAPIPIIHNEGFEK
jgi:anti-sigma factor RsiW